MVHLISHCNARLQAMLPAPPPPQHSLSFTSSPPAAAKATSNSPEASASDAQTQHQKLPSLFPSQLLVGVTVTEQPPVQPCHASRAEEEGEEQGSRADGQFDVQGPLVEAETGQAVAAAALELMLAVLRGSEDTGLLYHTPHKQCAQVVMCTTRSVHKPQCAHFAVQRRLRLPNKSMASRLFIEDVLMPALGVLQKDGELKSRSFHLWL